MKALEVKEIGMSWTPDICPEKKWATLSKLFPLLRMCPTAPSPNQVLFFRILVHHVFTQANLPWPLLLIYFASNSYSTTFLPFKALNSIWHNEFINAIIWLMSVFLLGYDFHDGRDHGSFCLPLCTWDIREVWHITLALK